MLDILLQYIKPAEKYTTSVLCVDRPDHRPLLPKMSIPQSDFYKLKHLVPNQHPSFQWTVHYPSAYPFKDILLVPVSFDQDLNLIYMCRIISKDIYDSWPLKRKPCAITQPIYVHIDKKQYVMVDEACFFSFEITSKRKNTSKMTRRIKMAKVG